MTQSAELNWEVPMTFAIAAEQYSERTSPLDQSSTGLGQYIASPTHLADAHTELSRREPQFARYDTESYVTEMAIKDITDVGRNQQFRILHACTAILPREMGKVEVGKVLRRSRSLGYLFGSISDRTYDDPSSSTAKTDYVADVVSSGPSMYLEFDGESIHYSEYGIRFIKQFVHKGMGCPALKQTVELASGKTTIFAASWSANTDDFIHEYVYQGKPFVYEYTEDDD